MDVYKFQWTLLVLMSRRNLLHQTFRVNEWVQVDVEMMGWTERCQCGKVQGHTGNHSYRRWKRRYNLVLSQQANPAMQGGKQVLFALSCPLLRLVKLPQTFLYNWHISSNPSLYTCISTWIKSVTLKLEAVHSCQTSELTTLITYPKSPKHNHCNVFNFHFCSIKQIF
jgi:hypothetical protein